ncbi:MAG: metal-dependent hydrolase [Gemmatimonadales bacterium]
MDNLAHTLVGAALGRAVADRHVPLAGVIGAVAANAPDWTELLIGLPGPPEKYLVLHRGITHSLVGALVQIVLLTLLVGGSWRVASRPPWRRLLACIGATVSSHLFMDWQGSYGWRPFLPWNATWFYLDWVAIADVFFWIVPLVALAWGANRHWIPLTSTLVVGALMTLIVITARDAAAPWVLATYVVIAMVAVVGWVRYWVGPGARQRAATVALLLLAIYSGAQGIAVQWRKAEIRRAAERRFGSGATWAALTEVGRPFTWEAMDASGDSVAGVDWAQPRHLRVPAVVRALRDTPDGRAMAQFARFLTAEVDTAEKTIYLRDARYARVNREGWGVVRVRME